MDRDKRYILYTQIVIDVGLTLLPPFLRYLEQIFLALILLNAATFAGPGSGGGTTQLLTRKFADIWP